MKMLEHPEIGWIERTGYPSWLQEQDDPDCDDPYAEDDEDLDDEDEDYDD